jgi:hypothetical protein
MTCRARRVEILPDTTCHFETDGDLIPLQSRYTVEMAGQIRLIVPLTPHQEYMPSGNAGLQPGSRSHAGARRSQGKRC